jgi:hypothetical protein
LRNKNAEREYLIKELRGINFKLLEKLTIKDFKI